MVIVTTITADRHVSQSKLVILPVYKKLDPSSNTPNNQDAAHFDDNNHRMLGKFEIEFGCTNHLNTRK